MSRTIPDSRITTALKTSEWLAAQIEETKSQVQDAEEKFRAFLTASGNVFAGPDATLDDTKLAQLKAELAKIQSERIARQTRYELTLKNPPESLGEVLDDSMLRGYQQQLQALKKDRAVLEPIYTAKHEKVQKVGRRRSRRCKRLMTTRSPAWSNASRTITKRRGGRRSC